MAARELDYAAQWVDGDKETHRRAEALAGVVGASAHTLVEKFPAAVDEARTALAYRLGHPFTEDRARRVEAAALAVTLLYRVEPVGGALHIVTDDLNLADEHLAQMEPARREESFALRRLLPLSPIERLAAITLADIAQSLDGAFEDLDFRAIAEDYRVGPEAATPAIAAYYGWDDGAE